MSGRRGPQPTEHTAPLGTCLWWKSPLCYTARGLQRLPQVINFTGSIRPHLGCIATLLAIGMVAHHMMYIITTTTTTLVKHTAEASIVYGTASMVRASLLHIVPLTTSLSAYWFQGPSREVRTVEAILDILPWWQDPLVLCVGSHVAGHAGHCCCGGSTAAWDVTYHIC